MIDARTVIGETALSFTVRAGWAHFRRIEANRTKMTYRLPPRTTIAGMLAAAVGYDRDSYYDLYGKDVSAIAVSIHPDHRIRTVSLPKLAVDTRDDVAQNGVQALAKIDTEAGRVVMPNPDATRQRYAYDYLVDPVYQIDVWLDDEEAYTALRDQLINGRSRYSLSLGRSECRAHIRPEEVHEHTIKATEVDSGEESDGSNDNKRDERGRRIRGAPSISVDSAVPGPIVEQIGITVTRERSPGWMTVDNHGGGSGRKTTGWIEWRLNPLGKQLEVRIDDSMIPVRIGDRTVVMT